MFGIKKFIVPFLIFITVLFFFTTLYFANSLVDLKPKLAPLSESYLENNNKLGSCHCVAFRLDDIDDNFLPNVQIEIMNLFKKKGLNLTIGVVGDYIGKGKILIPYIKERILNNSSNSSSIEIANHSWKHEDFVNLTLGEQSASIRKANEKIEKIFGVKPTAFIAPSSEFNSNTFSALLENNMTYFSADELDIPRISVYPNAKVYHFPETAQTGGNADDLKHPSFSAYPNSKIYHLPETAITGDCNNCDKGENNSSWYGLKHEFTWNQVNMSLEKYGYAVVVMHAMEFSLGHNEWKFENRVDLKQIKELESLIADIQKQGLQIVTLGNMANYFNTDRM